MVTRIILKCRPERPNTQITLPGITELQPSFSQPFLRAVVRCAFQASPWIALYSKEWPGCVVSGANGLFHGSSLMSSYDLPFTSKENSLDRLDDLLRRFREMESCAVPITSATKEE